MTDKSKCNCFQIVAYPNDFFDPVCDDMLMEEETYCSKLGIACPHCNGDVCKCMEKEDEGTVY